MQELHHLTPEERAEIHVKQITRSLSSWVEQECLPCTGRASGGDVVAILVGLELWILLEDIRHPSGVPCLEHLQRISPIPLILSYIPEGEAWTELLHAEVNGIYEALESQGWSPERERVARLM